MGSRSAKETFGICLAALGLGAIISSSFSTLAVIMPLAEVNAEQQRTISELEKRVKSLESKTTVTTPNMNNAQPDSDAAAKQTLEDIAAAQFAYIGISAERGDITFANMEELQENNLLSSKSDQPLEQDKVKVVSSGAGTTNAHFGASVLSKTGKIFYIGDGRIQPVEVTTFSSSANTIELKLEAAAEAGVKMDFDGNLTN